MKRFKGFVIKEFYHIFRDKRTMLILFGMPVVQILLFGYVITNEIKDIKIAILDRSKDNATTTITHKILSSGYFILSDNITHPEQIEPSFQQGVVKLIIVFEPDFAGKLERRGQASVQLIADATDANTASLIVNYTSAIITSYMHERNTTARSRMHITLESRMLYNERMKGAYMFVPGTMALILMLISAMMTSISIAREKESGTMETLLVSPLQPIQIILGKVTPYVLLSFTNAVTIILMGYLVFDVPVKGSLLLLMAECILFISLALSLGILISTAAKTQQVAMFISMFALMLPTMLLSGFIFPIENMPVILQWLSAVMPPRWFIVVIKGIMLQGVGLSYLWFETLVMVLMMLFFILMSVKRFKIRLE